MFLALKVKPILLLWILLSASSPLHVAVFLRYALRAKTPHWLLRNKNWSIVKTLGKDPAKMKT